MNKLKSNTNGFTIIEVVLVLAIAGLIFLMVFIALPALQNSQQDTQRRSDASRFLSAVTNYQTNNKGSVPTITDQTSLGTFIGDYLTTNGAQFNDPKTGVAYTWATSAPTNLGEIHYYKGYTCNGEDVQSGTARQVALQMKLTSGTYCTNN